MFGGLTYEQPLTTGKKVGGYQISFTYFIQLVKMLPSV